MEDLPRWLLEPLFDEQMAVAVYEAMTAVRQEWDRRAFLVVAPSDPAS